MRLRDYKLCQQVDYIMKNFDFKRVHKVMVYLSWKWHNDGDVRVPTLEEIKDFALTLLMSVSDCRGVTEESSGGFRARIHKDILSLHFEVESIDMGL